MRRDYVLAMLFVVTAVLASACAGAPAGSSAKSACPATIEAPVLYPGDTWIFRHDNGKRSRQVYDKVTEDGLLRGRGPKANAEYYYDHTHTVRKVYSHGTWLTWETRDFPEIGHPDLDFPLTLGKTWSLAMRDPSFALPIIAYDRVVGCEQVTVPAGSFFAVRIDLDGSIPGVPNATLHWSYWYAPAVKFWIKHTEGATWGGTPSGGFELESFTIDTGKPATPAAAISSLAQQGATAPVPPSAPAPIWERGYEWKYRWSSLQGSGTFVWEVARDELTSDVPQYVVRSGAREIHYRKADLAWMMERVDGAVATRATPASMGFKWPLAVGKEWEQTYTWENPGQGRTEEHTRQYKVEKLATVTIPAGTFQAFHVTSKDQTGRFIREYWYSPDVRWWVREKTMFSYGIRDRELVEYTLRTTGAPAP